MTDTLRELLLDSVADVEMPDVADRAWRAGVRSRRRRRAGVAAGAVAAAVVTVVATTTALAPSTQNEPASRPDGTFAGVPVWWAPAVGQESALPALPDSPLPPYVDLSAPAPDLASHPIPSAVAAYGIGSDHGIRRVVVVGPGGQLRTVDLSHVKPMTDPEGNRRIDAGPSMLSPSGDYLMFPQDLGIELLQISTGKWRWLYTLPGRSTWNAEWDSPGSILVPTREHYAYPIAVNHPANDWTTSHVASVPHRGSQRNGPFRLGAGGVAQAYYAGADVPQPPRLGLSRAQSEWIGVHAESDVDLVLPGEPGRQKGCCQVKAWFGSSTLAYESKSADALRLLAWRVGTGEFRKVTEVVGWRPGRQYVVSSYADTR